MAKLTGKGVPTRKTAGALGDIYTDTNTGKQYECVFSYRENSEGMFDCQWREVQKFRKETVAKKPVKEPVKVEEPVKSDEPVEAEKAPVEEVVAEAEAEATEGATAEEPEQKPTQKQRTNYTAYNNNKKK